ncbi:MAG: protein of unknown function (DUF4157) [Candidatus Methanocomedens sp.]|nr:MAG: protein of unknown function (DUF4157) [ANME-2 cluster archaeon]
MDKISRLYAKKPIVNKSNSSLEIQRKKSSQPQKSPADRILFLQRTIGNQAVQRLIKSGALQAKLRIGQPGDMYEQEADRVADEVMRMPEPGVQREVKPEEEETLQTKPLVNQITPLDQVQRQEEPEEEEEMIQAKPLAEEITPFVQKQVEPEEEEEELQAKATSGRISEVTPNLESNILSLKGGGKPLPENDRAFFEPRFGQDFSQVRLHTDTRAAESARTVNARAFTAGRDVVFGAGQYTVQTLKGKRLLAHELTHVMQQKGENKSSKSAILKSLDTNHTKTDSGTLIQRQHSSGIEEEVEGMGQEFRRERRRELSGIISRMRFQKVINDCPKKSGVRLLNILGQMRTKVNNNPRCVKFFQGNFGFKPDRLFAPKASPAIMVDPKLNISGRARCPSPSIRIQVPICKSPLRERVLMHELTHYAGCLTRRHTPSSEALAEKGENICIGTVQEVLEEARRHRVGGERHQAQ